jgi:hypothetical protein
MGDADDDALAESVCGLSNAGSIRRHGPLHGFGEAEYMPLAWAGQIINAHLLEPFGGVPTA